MHSINSRATFGFIYTLLFLHGAVIAFRPAHVCSQLSLSKHDLQLTLSPLYASNFPSNKYSSERRKKLGLGDEADEEYDLDKALDQNTDPLITKLIAGSLIVTLLSLVYVGLVQPAMNPVEGVCNPLLTQGRC